MVYTVVLTLLHIFMVDVWRLESFVASPNFSKQERLTFSYFYHVYRVRTEVESSFVLWKHARKKDMPEVMGLRQTWSIMKDYSIKLYCETWFMQHTCMNTIRVRIINTFSKWGPGSIREAMETWLLTHLPLDKMAAISQTAFSNAV